MAYLLRDAKLPLPFCPGCAGHALARALDRALEQLGCSGLDVCLVTDIGCNGLMDQYFDTLAFHGLHGRSITYGTGIKLAQPHLKVIVLMGDGGTGIGGGHLLSAARRDVDITLLVLNNFNYGMTGGQHSATTPLGSRTSTTVQGNVEQPLDICGAAQAAGGRFAARKLSSDRDLDKVLATAVEHRGFSVVDVVGPCSAYFMPRNQISRTRELASLVDGLGWDLGILRQKEGDDFLTRYRAAYPRVEPAATPGPTGPEIAGNGLSLPGRLELVLAASAGHRVRFAGTALASAVLQCGGWAVQKDDYPITVRSGYSVTELVLDNQPIEYLGVDSPTYMVVASPEGLARVAGRLGCLSPDATVLADETLGPIDTPATVERHPMVATAKSVDKNLVALVSMVLLAMRAQIVPLDLIRSHLAHRGSEAVIASNLAVFDAAVQAFS